MRIAFVGDSLTEGVPGVSYFRLLRGRFPQHELVNLGRRSDTVGSLHRRIDGVRFGAPFDLTFLWIGVNDVTASRPRVFELVTALSRQPAARNLDEFRSEYRAVLDLLGRHSRRVVTVPPVFRGEDPHSAPNRQGAALAAAIVDLTHRSPNAEYLDLRALFLDKLDAGRASPYLQRNPLRVVWDDLTLRDPDRIDRVSARRGLQFTADGVHLNSAGAKVVAEAFGERIEGRT
jgi:lysophospholipase L1-like esterase